MHMLDCYLGDLLGGGGGGGGDRENEVPIGTNRVGQNISGLGVRPRGS